jgi:hypothetical protein
VRIALDAKFGRYQFAYDAKRRIRVGAAEFEQTAIVFLAVGMDSACRRGNRFADSARASVR